MKINLISNINNGKGLEKDTTLLRGALASLRHEATAVHYRVPDSCPQADLNIFLETADERFFRFAPRQWFIPNVEWLLDEYLPLIPKFEQVLCKTADAARIMRGFTDRVVYTGFCTQDHYNPLVAKKPKFLHAPGNSIIRNTGAVIDAWARRLVPPEAELSVVSDVFYSSRPVPNVRFYERVSDDKLAELENEHLFHLCTSKYEGWGQNLHQAKGVAAFVVTVDGSPMNTFDCPMVIPPASFEILRHTKLYRVRAEAVAEAVKRCLDMPLLEVYDAGLRARDSFLKSNADFLGSFSKLLRSPAYV